MAALTVITSTTLLLMLLQLSITTATATATCFRHNRHLLHQPFFPVVEPPTQAPSSSSSPKPSQIPKMPFSSSTSSSSTPPEEPFFPSIRPTPPPPSPTALTSFPANISSLLFPQTSSSSSSPHRHVIAIAASVSAASAAAILLAAAFLLHRRQQRKLDPASDDKASRTDSLHLFPPNTVASDEAHKLHYHHHSSAAVAPPPNRTTENFLYLGTLSTPKTNDEESAATTSNASSKFGSGSPYQRLGSPELTPLPPLPKLNNNFRRSYNNELGSDDDDDDDKFFSPRGSSASPKNVAGVMSKPVPLDSSVSPPLSYASRSVSPPQLNLSPTSLKSSSSPDSVINSGAPPPTRPGPIFPASVTRSLSSSSTLSERVSAKDQNSPDFVAQMKKSLVRNNSAPKRFVPVRLPPPPPPPPPPLARFWVAPVDNAGPPVHVAPSSRVARVFQNGKASVKKNEEEDESVERSEETTPRPKLKPLHWDKVRASSDHAMVWDQLKSSSFQLNEEMIETLFVVNNSSSAPKDHARRQILPSANEENRVLDPKKSQNIAILLRALNVTIDEVCEALLEGNTDTLGTELLESLLKMAPTKEEERKLREFKDESPFKLGPAEKFLKAVLDIPFAFKRVDAMLYIASFDSEVDYLKRSFETLEAACEELKNSRMFLKLLEAVLKTGNRMNVGTNRGDAHAFKLDTLLKLVDVKGADGKTTLLHFVVQEIIRAEGSRLSGTNQDDIAESSQQSSFRDEVEFRKRGLQVVSGLSGELINVKKAAGMDSDVLSNEVAKIAGGITKIAEIVGGSALKESSHKFFESMDGFWKKAREEIVTIQAQEKLAFCMVKEITEYFHGNSTKEEAHPFRIFTVVRDFLSVLDQACKVVGKVNERTIVGSARQFPVSSNHTLTAVFPGLGGKQHYGHPDDESSP